MHLCAYTVWCLSKSYAHNNNCKKNLWEKKEGKEKKATAQIGTNVTAHEFNAGLLARSQFASGRSCDQPTRSRFSVVFLGPRENAELVPKFQVALHASHAALPMVTLKISPYINVTDERITYGYDPARDCTANYRLVLSSERAPYMK
jgi:hypothetical protein